MICVNLKLESVTFEFLSLLNIGSSKFKVYFLFLTATLL